MTCYDSPLETRLWISNLSPTKATRFRLMLFILRLWFIFPPKWLLRLYRCWNYFFHFFLHFLFFFLLNLLWNLFLIHYHLHSRNPLHHPSLILHHLHQLITIHYLLSPHIQTQSVTILNLPFKVTFYRVFQLY